MAESDRIYAEKMAERALKEDPNQGQSYLDDPETFISNRWKKKKKKKDLSASNKVSSSGSAAEFDEEDYHPKYEEDRNKNAAGAADRWIKKMYPNLK